MKQEMFHGFVDRYADMLFRIAINYCRNFADAEDMVQEVFLKILPMDIDCWEEEDAKRFMIRIVINCCKNHLKSAWNRKVAIQDKEILFQYMDRQADRNGRRQFFGVPDWKCNN